MGQVYPVEKQNTALWLRHPARSPSAHSQISLPGRGPNHTQPPSGVRVKPPSRLGRRACRSGARQPGWKRQPPHPWGAPQGPSQPNAPSHSVMHCVLLTETTGETPLSQVPPLWYSVNACQETLAPFFSPWGLTQKQEPGIWPLGGLDSALNPQ